MSAIERHYSIVPGFFVQDDASTKEAVPPRFGLLDDSPDRWATFLHRLKELNSQAPHGTSYKAIFAGRHGEGYHNVAEAKYGTDAWEAYWANLDGDGTLVWGPDALLTEVGEGQARDARAMWAQELSAGLALPERFYCSPMTRALQTCQITFDGLLDYERNTPLILENCRERYGKHTCDKRRTKTYLQETFPKFAIEEGFAEEDPLFDPEVRETEEHVAHRARIVLNRIFEHDPEHVVSITAHSGFINGLLDVTRHIRFPLPTGGILPMVVRCDTVPLAHVHDGQAEY